MIRFPPNTRPCELLYLAGGSEFVTQLLETSRRLQQEGRWTEAEQSAHRALEASQEPGEQATRGAALIHLVDVHLAVGGLGAALQEARSAYRLFSAQPARYQRHNEAIAAYALGLAHQSLGNRLEALKWYEKSGQLLERASLAWTTRNAKSRARSCRRLQHWIQALSEGLGDSETPPSYYGPTSVWLPFLLPESDAGFGLAPLQVERYEVAPTVELSGQTFRIELVGGLDRPSLQAAADYYALQIPGAALELLDADDGDYAVIERRAEVDREGPGVLETLGGMEFGRFKRKESGEIIFVKTDMTIIGGRDFDDDFLTWYVTALLKPT